MATRQKYERLKKTIIKGGEPTQVTISSREMKSTIAKAYGITIEEVDKKYYLFRNKLRAYESLKRESGVEVTTQSPLNLMYKQAKSMLRHGADYKPSNEFEAINTFSAVSISKGERLAKATESRYYKKHQAEIGSLALAHFDKFINGHTSAKELKKAYLEGKITGVQLQASLAQMAKDVKAIQKQKRAGGFSSGQIGSDSIEIPSAEEYIKDFKTDNAKEDDETLKEKE